MRDYHLPVPQYPVGTAAQIEIDADVNAATVRSCHYLPFTALSNSGNDLSAAQLEG